MNESWSEKSNGRANENRSEESPVGWWRENWHESENRPWSMASDSTSPLFPLDCAGRRAAPKARIDLAAHCDQTDCWSDNQANDSQQLWRVSESTGSIAAGAWAAKKFSSDMVEEKSLNAAQRSELRMLRTGHAFSALLAATVVNYTLDSLGTANESAGECTICADWLLAPLLSLRQMPWLGKFASLAALHALARYVDHIRKPGAVSPVRLQIEPEH